MFREVKLLAQGHMVSVLAVELFTPKLIFDSVLPPCSVIRTSVIFYKRQQQKENRNVEDLES